MPAREERIHIAYLAASPYAGQRITVHLRSLVAILHFCYAAEKALSQYVFNLVLGTARKFWELERSNRGPLV